MKTAVQLLRDRFRLAAFHSGRGLKVALGVKGKWKKYKNRGKDYPGQPEMAHMHEIHPMVLHWGHYPSL
jgi:hypothetical protein